MVSNEVRDRFAQKYQDKNVKSKVPNRLLFVTTTSAYGKSSIYDRITHESQKVGEFIGYTSGWGTFHFSEEIYDDQLRLLESKGVDIRRGYGTGASRKLRLIYKALRLLGIPDASFHNVKRGYYIFPNVSNLSGVIHSHEKPLLYDRPFDKPTSHWMLRWCIPRSTRIQTWKAFNPRLFVDGLVAQVISQLRGGIPPDQFATEDVIVQDSPMLRRAIQPE